MSSESSPSNEGAEVSALDAAKAYFPPEGSNAPAATPPAATPPAGEQKPAPSVIDSILKPATPPAATPQTPPATVVEEIDKGLQAPPENAKSRAGWDELKKRAQTVAQEKADLAKRIAELEAKQKATVPAADEATLARLKQLEEENGKYSSRLKVLDTRNHPEFVAKYVEPANAAKQAMSQIAQTEEVQLNVDELLSLKGKALNAGISDAMEKMTPYARVKFQSAIDSYFQTTVAADQALAHADEFLKNARQSTSARSRETFDKVASSYQGVFIAAPVDDKAPDAVKAADGSYNASLAQVGKRAEALAFGQIDETGVAELAHKASLYEFTLQHALPRLERVVTAQLAAKDARIAELEGQVKGLSAAQPNVSGGAGASGGEATPPAEQSHLAAAAKFFPS